MNELWQVGWETGAAKGVKMLKVKKKTFLFVQKETNCAIVHISHNDSNS